MKLALLMLMAVYTVGNVSGMSTCKTLDLEMVKKKRIEAIRSQILSKLRLPKEPDQAGDEEEIPTPLLSLYNSTKEMLREQQTEVQTDISTEQEEEEYFAKVLHKFNMTGEYQITQNRNTSVMCAHGRPLSRMGAIADGLTTALRMSSQSWSVIYAPTFTGTWCTLLKSHTHGSKDPRDDCFHFSSDLTLTRKSGKITGAL